MSDDRQQGHPQAAPFRVTGPALSFAKIHHRGHQGCVLYLPVVIGRQISRLEHVSSSQTDQAGAGTWDKHAQVQTPPPLTPTPEPTEPLALWAPTSGIYKEICTDR